MTLKLSAEITHNSDSSILGYGVSFTAIDLTSFVKWYTMDVSTKKGNTMSNTKYRLSERDLDSFEWKWVEDAPYFDCVGDACEWLEAQDIHPDAIESHFRAILCWDDKQK